MRACTVHTPRHTQTHVHKQTPPLGDINFSARAFRPRTFPLRLCQAPRDPGSLARTLRVATFGGHFKPTDTNFPAFLPPCAFYLFAEGPPPSNVATKLPICPFAGSFYASCLSVHGWLPVGVSRRLPGLDGKSRAQVALASFRSSLDHERQTSEIVCDGFGENRVARVAVERVGGI